MKKWWQMKHSLSLFGLAPLIAAAAPPQQAGTLPSVRIADPKSLDGVIRLGPFR